MSQAVNEFITIYSKQRRELEELKCEIDRSRSECESLLSLFNLKWISEGTFLAKLNSHQRSFANFRIKERGAKETIEALRAKATYLQTIDQTWIHAPDTYCALKQKIDPALMELVRRIDLFFQEEVLLSWNRSKTAIELCLKTANVSGGWFAVAYETLGWPRFEEWIKPYVSQAGPPCWSLPSGAAPPPESWDVEIALLSQASSKIERLIKAYFAYDVRTQSDQ